MKQIKKKPLKKKTVKVVEEFEEECDDAWEEDVCGSEPAPRLKPLRLRVVVNNGYDIVVQDIHTKFMYAVEKQWDPIALMDGKRNVSYGLRLLGIQNERQKRH